MGKGNKKKDKGKDEGMGKKEYAVMKLIKDVDTAEKDFLEFGFATPSDEEMNTMFIPQPNVNTPPRIWFLDGRNLLNTVNPEWGEAWSQFCISKEIEWFGSDFSSQSEEVQNEGIKYMVDFVKRTRRILMYKKHQYALQKKKKEEVRMDELNRQVEFIEGQKDKGKGKLKGEQAKIDKNKGISIKESAKSEEGKKNEAKDDYIEGHKGKGKLKEEQDDWSAKSEEGKMDEAKDVAGAEEVKVDHIEGHKDKGKLKEEQDDWSAKSEEGKMDEAKDVAGAEEVKEKLVDLLAGVNDVDDSTTIHGGGGSAKSEEKAADEAKEDEVVVEVDHTLGFLAIPGSVAAFPSYEDGDNVVCYTVPFSLKSWMRRHMPIDSRWLPSWPDMGLNNVHWGGDRLKRESLIVMQSLLSAVLDYHEHYGPHGNLWNHANIIFSQRVDSFGGSQKVWFQIQLPEPNSLDAKILNDQFEVTTYLTKDMEEVNRIFGEILEGRDLDVDMEYLLNFLLKRYPFKDKEAWRTQVLRNFPGFWYGQQRASFTINVYYNWMCDSEKSAMLLRAIQNVRRVTKVSPDLKCMDWIKKISTDSIFYEILIFPPKDSENKEDDDPKPQYSEGSAEKVLKYMRDTLHHYRETHGAGSMKIRQIELYLSNF
ncbi:hypothetical protein OROGR_001643 [Orobanche gracilis]